jgi:hypothetical protein
MSKDIVMVTGNECGETIIEAGEIAASVTDWGNAEGATLCVEVSQRRGAPLLLASLRWEEIELLVAAVSAAKARA